MTVRRLLCAAAALAVALGFAPSLAHGQPARRPNVLVILSDDHAAAHVGCYGNPDVRTPNLDRLAREGLRGDRFYVTTPQCVPSRASLMTGRSPVAIDMTRFSAPLPREVPIYPELLRAAGYYAGVAGRTYHLDGSGKAPPETARVFEERKLRTFPDRLDYVQTAGAGPQALEQFREFLGRVPAGKAFVLQLCFSEPHRPLDKNAIPEPHDPAKIKLPPHFPDTELLRADFARYYDEIARMDGYVGQVLEELERRGLADNTIIVFMGDNGAALLRGKGTLYDFGLRVPLLVRWPNVVRPGSTSPAILSGEDIAPTLLEAAGVAVPKEMTGKSFLKLLRGEPFEGRTYAFSQRGAHGSSLPNSSSAFDLGRCVTGKTHKLIYNALWQIPYHPVDFAGDAFWKELQEKHQAGDLQPLFSRLYFTPTRPMFELYDLQSDPFELNNLAGRKEVAAVERELKGALQEWMILERDFVPLPVPPPPQKKAGKKKAG